MLFGNKGRAHRRHRGKMFAGFLALGFGAAMLLTGCAQSGEEGDPSEESPAASVPADPSEGSAVASVPADPSEESSAVSSAAGDSSEGSTGASASAEASSESSAASAPEGEKEESKEGSSENPAAPVLTDEDYVPAAYANLEVQTTPSVGEVAWPLFVVEFQDAKYTDDKISQEEMQEWVFGDNKESVAGFYNESSHGRIHMSGDVYYYTAEGNIGDYETYIRLEGLIMECMNHFDGEVDFSKYDANGDGVMDAFALSVPRGGKSSFWWAAQGEWYSYPEYTIDGVKLMSYIVSDEQPYKKEKKYYIGTLRHEMGHCMGLPDYYKYNYEGTDYEGLHGNGGKEIMDDSEGDFSQFSKLQLGWLTKEQVQIMPDDAEKMTFFLPPAEQGGCIVIFPEGKEHNFQGEYFVIEYVTPEGYNAGLVADGGVRILHAQAEFMSSDGIYYEYKYNNYSQFYDVTNNGIRVLKLIRDGRGFFHSGDEVTYESTGEKKGNFGWYTEDGGITPPGLRIRIGELQEESGCMEIEVIRE